MSTGQSVREAAAGRRTMLEGFYRAFNERDIDTALEHLAPGVDWPAGMTGRRIVGRAAVRDYWQKQWQERDPRVEPLTIDVEPDGSARVLVDQLIRSLDGKILAKRQIEHVYEFEGPFIRRMTILDSGRFENDEED